MTSIDIRELPARLEELIALAARGQKVILRDGDTPRVELVPVRPPHPGPRIPDLNPGAMIMRDDFDDPLELVPARPGPGIAG